DSADRDERKFTEVAHVLGDDDTDAGIAHRDSQEKVVPGCSDYIQGSPFVHGSHHCSASWIDFREPSGAIEESCRSRCLDGCQWRIKQAAPRDIGSEFDQVLWRDAVSPGFS